MCAYIRRTLILWTFYLRDNAAMWFFCPRNHKTPENITVRTLRHGKYEIKVSWRELMLPIGIRKLKKIATCDRKYQSGSIFISAFHLDNRKVYEIELWRVHFGTRWTKGDTSLFTREMYMKKGFIPYYHKYFSYLALETSAPITDNAMYN